MTEDELGEYLTEHIDRHEVDMLNRTFELLRRWDETTFDRKTIHDALIESFCVHARALFELFTKETNPGEYQHRYTREGYKHLGHYTKRRRRQLNNQVLHVLGEGRTTDDKKKITRDERLAILREIDAEWRHFKANRKGPFDKCKLRDVGPRPEYLVVSFSDSSTQTGTRPEGVAITNPTASKDKLR
jgi:hypothetical protein